jgi:hypothetical protein
LAIVTALNDLNLAFPDVDKSKRKELEKVRESLEHERISGDKLIRKY